MKTIFLCPGQGSQKIGMGVALRDTYPAAKAVFDEVDEALGLKLSIIMSEGPINVLTSTQNAQPALMACAVAAFEALKAETGKSLPDMCDYVAGHSLGEYAALTIAGTFDLTTSAKLLKTRGEAMQAAAPEGVGAMAAILNLDWDTLYDICNRAAQGESVQCANDNSPGQIVISGHKAAIERAMEMAMDAGAKRAILLPVSAPFHSRLMEPAAAVMKEALSEAVMNEPYVPVITNVSVECETHPDVIRKLLVDQVTGTVRWRETMFKMKELGVERSYELGGGNVLSGLIKRTTEGIESKIIATPEDINNTKGEF